jgi:cell cycle serine/threonine-protein kinase CDC5/MSD2
MAPEILTGKNTAADPAIDIFSIGVILYALVVGKLPFDGKETFTIRNKIINGDFSFPPGNALSPDCKDLI